MMNRSSGILMPIFSLPGGYGIGNLGAGARSFVDFLVEAKQAYWQILPIGPTGYGDSPYQSFSAFAGNPYFIDLDRLAKDGYLDKTDLTLAKTLRRETGIDYAALYETFPKILEKATARLEKEDPRAYHDFLWDEGQWLEDYAFFMAIKEDLGSIGLAEWPDDLRTRKEPALSEARARLAPRVEYYKRVQFFFYAQWNELKDYANENGVKIIGDIPIYVSPDSSDLWAAPHLFQTDKDGKLARVAGCPPDGFSADGQLWGNPLYNWDAHKYTDFAWWCHRMKHATSTYDVVRVDHFRGFESYYSIDATADHARDGHWCKGPDMDLMRALFRVMPEDAVIAEDLGFITPEVAALLAGSGFPGMKVLQFAFDHREPSDYLPHRYTPNSVVYTGTHDNTTTCDWHETTDAVDLAYACRYLGMDATADAGSFTLGMIRAALASVSNLAVTPMADWLRLPVSARINTPSTTGDNWQWRMASDAITEALTEEIAALTELYGRG